MMQIGFVSLHKNEILLGDDTFKAKVIVALIILISLLSVSCVNADDSNSTDIELGVNEEEPLELNYDEILQVSDEDILQSADEVSLSGSNSKSSAYLILDNDADIEKAYVGDYVVWIVSVINKGPDTAKNVKVFDELPDGLKYVNHHATKGSFNPKTGIWNIGDLAIEDGEMFLNITTLATSVGEKINMATLTTDSINLNDESYEEEEIDVFEPAKKHESNYLVKVDAAKASYPTGNPLALVFVSLFAILVTSLKSKKQ